MHQQRTRTATTTRNRSISREDHSPSMIFTALTVGVVALLLAVTFAADWLRTPEISISSAPQFLSPNHDNSFDSATITYRLSEESQVTARVISEGGGVIRTLLQSQKEVGGQHFLVWNGLDDTGQQAADGNYRLEISASGSVRSTAASVILRVDTVPPNLELLNLQDGTRVKDSLLIIEGITEKGATVWVSGSSQPVAVDGQGRFRTQNKLTEGANQIEVRAADEAGNTTSLTRSIDLVTAPPQVVINSPIEGEWVNNPKVTVEGQAPAGTTIKINNQAVPITPDGAFRYDLLLDEGDQRILVSATDDVGNITTVERALHVKTHGPALEVSVADGSSISDSQLQLTGTTSPGSSVTVNNRGIAVGALGDFQTTVSLLEGENTIKVEALDQAGNTTALTRRVSYIIPTEPGGLERLARNLGTLPSITIPAVILLSLLLGFFLYRQNQLSIQLSIDTQTFTPGLPQEDKNLTLRLDLNQPARVTLEVLDQNGETQATLLDNRRRSAREHVFLWDGYDDFGRPVAPGPYTIRAIAGAPPIKVSSAVQMQVEEDPYVYHQSGQFDKIQGVNQPQQIAARRRMRQNRKRI